MDFGKSENGFWKKKMDFGKSENGFWILEKVKMDFGKNVDILKNVMEFWFFIILYLYCIFYKF